MRTLLALILSLACLCARGQTLTKLGPLEVNGGLTNVPMATGTGAYLVFADSAGGMHVAPWTTNQWLFLTNSSGGAAGYSNVWTPLTLYGVIGVNIGGTVGSFTNGGFLNPSFTNAVNYGSPFSSPGTNLSEQFGVGAQAIGSNSVALGAASTASGSNSTAVGYAALGYNTADSAFGMHARAQGSNSLALGTQSTTTAPGATALGYSSSATHSNSTAIGFSAATTLPMQIMMGSAGVGVYVNNYLAVLGGATFGNGVTNLWLSGTNTFLGGSDVAFTRYPVTSLANGNNAGVIVGTNVFVEVSGPSGAFTINGINGSPNRDGKLLILKNATGQTMTLANQSGVDAVAANRILTGYSADHAYTNNPGMVTLIYDGNAARWVVVSQNGNQ